MKVCGTCHSLQHLSAALLDSLLLCLAGRAAVGPHFQRGGGLWRLALGLPSDTGGSLTPLWSCFCLQGCYSITLFLHRHDAGGRKPCPILEVGTLVQGASIMARVAVALNGSAATRELRCLPWAHCTVWPCVRTLSCKCLVWLPSRGVRHPCYGGHVIFGQAA